MSKRLSIEDMRHLAAKQGGKCLSDIYFNNRLPLEWECSKKHRWFARPSNIKSGHWCPHCSPNAAVMLGKEGLLKKCQQIAESRGGNCLSDIYMTARKPLQWQCSKGHIWKATPDNVKRGKWCPKCAKVAIQLAKIKYSKDECEQYAKKHGGKLLKADTKYRNNWLWECSNGHQWKASPSQVVGSQTWCKRCLSYEANFDNILQSLTKRNIRIISGKIINAKSRLLLECENGHRWEASIASVYLNKSGCPFCAGHLRLSIEDAQKVAALKGGRCLSREYKNARSQLLWVCKKGHKWKATFGSVSGGQSSNGTWCPTCSLENIQPKYTTGDALSLAESRGGKFLSGEMKKVLSLYKWQCANGHSWKASFSSIYNNSSWCPTCSRHLGERLTRIAFETLFQHQFPTDRPAWLRTELGAQMSLDGYCKALELAFEHQGEQHYSERNYFGNTPEEQKKIQEYDQRKVTLCKQHGVTLIHIPEVPRLTPLDTLRDVIINACLAANIVPLNIPPKIQYERAYIEDGRLNRLKKMAEAKGGELVEKTYFGMRHRYKWRCEKRHEWHQTATCVVNRGTWCPYCAGRHNITLGQLQEKAGEKGGKILTEVYKNRTQKVTCRCVKGHTFDRVARSLMSGSWCPKCR